MSTSTSTIQNRTLEFKQCVSSFNKLNKAKPTQAQTSQKLNKSEFSLQASVIAKDIAHTTELLGKLSILAKRKPLFDDKPVEIGELTYVIKQDIFKIQKNLKNLEASIRGDSKINSSNQVGQHSKNVITLLNSKMKNVSGGFKDVLEVRQQNEILNKNRTQQFLSAATSNQVKLNNSVGAGSENPFMMQAASSNTGAASKYDPDQDPDVSVPGNEYLSIPDQTQQLLLMEEQQSEYLQERNRAVGTIESTINEVGNLFQQLATMVSEQGEVIQRIDQNVEDISVNISGAQRELLKYYAHISSNRWLFFKIFGVIMIFFLLWVLVS